MKEYIERKAIGKIAEEIKPNFAPLHRLVIDAFIYAIVDKVPLADVTEAVHGKWIDSHGNIVCSVCEAEYSDEIRFMNRNYKGELLPYCPNCSAKMDKEN